MNAVAGNLQKLPRSARGSQGEAARLSGRWPAPDAASLDKRLCWRTGGFGTAFLCHDRNFDQDVVVKTIHQAEMDRSMTDVFREARLLRMLNHPGIIGVHECEYADATNQACHDCNQRLALTGPSSELVQLREAVRRDTVDRRGEVVIADRCVYEYYVHGAGYSFKKLPGGKEIHFDVAHVEGAARIRFSVLSIVRYASSLGITVAPETVQSDLNRLSIDNPCIAHVIDGLFDYYYWMGE